MKSSMWKVCVMVALLIAAVNANATVLFSDSYDRADDTNISASDVGMGGTLSPLTYSEDFEGSGVGSIKILSNTLRVAVGVGMSSMHINQNFTNQMILDDGGFSVSLEVVQIDSATSDIINRWGGFGVGLTEAEAAAAGDLNDSETTLRSAGDIDPTTVGVSDFYADIALDGNLRVWNNGTLLNTFNVGAPSGTITVNFLVPDFNAGSSVTAMIYYNDGFLGSESFVWDHTGANYIGVSGRASNKVILDNLEIATVPEPATLLLLGVGAALLRKRK